MVGSTLSPPPTDVIVPCQPVTASYFCVENSVLGRGIRADIRRFAWRQSFRARFNPDAHYLDYSLGPRARGARLLSSDIGKLMPFGEVSFIPKGGSFEATGEPSEYRVLSLTFDDSAVAPMLESEDLPSSLSACFDVRLPIVRQGLARLADEVTSPGFAQDILIEAIATTLIVDICRQLHFCPEPEGAATARMADWRLRRLKDRIEAGIASELTIASLAKDCGMSPRHLMRTFKNTVGVTISSYIADLRIEQAKRELAREDALIKVVGGNCGFQSAAAFSAAFRKATGLSPRGYREELLRQAH